MFLFVLFDVLGLLCLLLCVCCFNFVVLLENIRMRGVVVLCVHSLCGVRVCCCRFVCVVVGVSVWLFGFYMLCCLFVCTFVLFYVCLHVCFCVVVFVC